MLRDFDQELEVMKMYTANASLFIKLSTAALALTVTFPEKILKVQDPVNSSMNSWVAIFIWVGFLIAIGAGAFYQYLAGKYMENLLPGGAGFRAWNWLASQCGIVYGIMLLSFYGSAIIFTVHAIAAVTK